MSVQPHPCRRGCASRYVGSTLTRLPPSSPGPTLEWVALSRYACGKLTPRVAPHQCAGSASSYAGGKLSRLPCPHLQPAPRLTQRPGIAVAAFIAIASAGAPDEASRRPFPSLPQHALQCRAGCMVSSVLPLHPQGNSTRPVPSRPRAPAYATHCSLPNRLS